MELKSLLALTTMGIIAESTEQMYYRAENKPRKEPPNTLTTSQKSKRSKRNKQAKQSRKQNRK